MPVFSKKKFVKLKVLGLIIKISSNSLRLINYVSRVYSLFKYKANESFSTKAFKKRLSVNLRSKQPESLESVEDSEFQIKKLIFKTLRGKYLFLHASSLATKNKSLVFIGSSGSGKSTLVSKLTGPGRAVLSEDLTVIDYQSKQTHYFPTFSHIREANILKNEENNREIEKLRKKYKGLRQSTIYLMDQEEFGLLYNYHKKLYTNKIKNYSKFPRKLALIFLNRNSQGSPGLRKAELSGSFEKILASAFLPSKRIKRDLKKVLEVISSAECYELNLGKTEQTVALLKRFLLK